MRRCLLGGSDLHGQLAAVVAARGAYGVIDVVGATVGAYGERGSYCLVMRSALERTSLRLSSFRMCHVLIYLIVIILK